TTSNYISKIEFQLSSINYPEIPSKPYMSTWNELATTLLKDEQFGADLTEKNNSMNDEIKNLAKRNDALSNAKRIYNYVRANFNCTDYDALYLPENLKKSFASKKGNIAEINLLLVAMLKKAEINADPVLLSTTDNGKAYEMYPLIKKFNYVIARVIINNKVYLLDASRKKLGFNHLPQYCYNGYGRLINETPNVVELFADSLTESKMTSIFIENNENDKNLVGFFNSNLGYYESYNFRENMKDNEIEDYFKKIKNGFNYDVVLTNNRLDSLKNPDEKLSIGYDFSFNFTEDIVYFNPLFGEAYKTNPFMAATRNYPVEMPYKTKEVIIVNMEIPKGYTVDEMPKSTRMKYNEEEGQFEYIITKDATHIYLQCILRFNKAIFSPEDYESLREFYGLIVKKQSEQIVFKKIK
ncbi:MAG: transglutaminase-like domain-containing protein, partial [Ferruginibacter sp.]|nr:transglutaminase-like domain-containing protein [Ferruginibacter sp.]